MKVCQKCGTQNEDRAVCCTGCGNRLDSPVAATSSFSDNVVDTVKKMGRSPVFIVAIAAVILTTLLTLWQVVESVMNYINYGSEYYYGYSFSPYLVDLLASSISFIMIALISLGMILFFSACVSKKKPVSTAGLTMIKTIQIIKLVVITIVFAIIILLSIILLVIPNMIGMDNIFSSIYQYSGYDLNDPSLFGGISFGSIFNILVIIIIVFTIISLVLVFLYYMKTLKTIKSVRLALKTGQPNNKASMYIVVMNFIIIAVTFLGMIGNVMSYLSGESTFYGFIIITVTSFLSVITLLFIAIGIIMYRSKMNSLMNGPQTYGTPTPVYTQPVSQPVQAEPSAPVTPSNSVFCTKCGSKIAEGSGFCTSCGQKV